MLSLVDQQAERKQDLEALELREPASKQGEENRPVSVDTQDPEVRSIGKECSPSRITNDKCPACGNGNIVLGRYLDQLAGGLLPVFRPRGLKPFTLTGSDVRIPAGDRFCCCVECGHLWSSLKPDQLLRVLQRYGNRQTRERFGSDGWHWLG